MIDIPASLRLSLTRTNVCLTDLGFHNPPSRDVEGVAQLMSMLPNCEAVVADRFLSITVYDSSLGQLKNLGISPPDIQDSSLLNPNHHHSWTLISILDSNPNGSKAASSPLDAPS